MKHSQIQVPNSDGLLPSFIPIYYADSQESNNLTTLNIEQSAKSCSTVSCENCSYRVTTTSMTSPQTSQTPVNSTSVQTGSLGNPQNQIPNIFFYRPPKDHCQYYVSCKKISNNFVIELLNKGKENIMQLKENEYIFFYKQKFNDQIYQVSCEIVSPTFINNCLNNIHGIVVEQNMEQEQLTFTVDQEKNLELHLSQYLSNYLLN